MTGLQAAMPWILFAIVVLCGIFAYSRIVQVDRRFRQEKSVLGDLQPAFRGFTAATDPDEVRRAAQGRVGLATQLVEGAYDIRELPNASMEPLIGAVVEETSSWLTPLRSTPNLLMLIGLVVTLLGLTLTVSNLQVMNSDGEVTADTLTRVLPTALSHMGTAFVGSLAGVFWSAVLNVRLAGAVRSQQEYLKDLALFAHTRVAPVLVRPRFDEQVEQLTKAITASSAMYREVRAGIDESTGKFSALLDRAGGIIESQLKQLQDSAQEVYGTLVTVSGDVTAGARALQESSRDLNAYHGELKNAHTELEGMFRRSQDDLDRRAGALLEKMQDMQTDYGVSTQQVMGGVMKSVERLDDLHARIGLAAQRFEEGGTQVTGAVHAAFTGLHGMLDATLTDHAREMATVGEKLGAFTTTFADVVDINRDLRRISERVQAAEDARAAAVQQAMDATGQSVNASVQLLAQHLADQGTGFRTATEHLGGTLDARLSEVTGILAAQPEQFGVLMDAHRAQVEDLQVSLADAFMQATESLSTLVREQPLVTQTITEAAAAAQLQALREQAATQGATYQALLEQTRAALELAMNRQGEAGVSQQRALHEQLLQLNATLERQSGLYRDLMRAQDATSGQLGEAMGRQIETLQRMLDRQQEQGAALLAAQASSPLEALIREVLTALRSQAAADESGSLKDLRPVVNGLERLHGEVSRGLLRLEQQLGRRPVPARPLEPAESGIS